MSLDSSRPELLSIGSAINVAVKDAIFSALSGRNIAAADHTSENDVSQTSLQKLLLPPISGVPDGGALRDWALESPLSTPLAVAGSAEAAAFEAAVMVDAQAVAAEAGLPAAAAAALEPQLPQTWPSFSDVVHRSLLNGQHSARLPEIAMHESLIHSRSHLLDGESALASWQQLCADCGMRRISLATVALQLDWALTGPPGCGIGALHRSTPQVTGFATAGRQLRQKQDTESRACSIDSRFRVLVMVFLSGMLFLDHIVVGFIQVQETRVPWVL